MTIEKYVPAQLSMAAVVPQVLDNQWVPKDLLGKMIKGKKALKDVKIEREKYVLKEWRRALVYGEQVVVNRAFMFNNEIIVDDYDDEENREHFKNLLNTKVIVPYLLYEDNPGEKPNFNLNESLWKAWMDVVDDTQMACVRLNWGDQSGDMKRLSTIYHNYIQTLNTRADHLAGYLGIKDDLIPTFKKRLKKIVSYAVNLADKRMITRNDMYREFVCADDTNPAEGWYANKAFAAQIKQIADLKYNVNLPDALGRYALTPEDSPPRVALGDLDDVIRTQAITDENVDEILQALRGMAFSKITGGMYLRSLSALNLGDVIKVRATDEWEEYRIAFHNLLNQPLKFPHYSAVLSAKFAALNERITRFRHESEQAKWEPWVKLLISVGAKAIELAINPADPSQKLLSTIGTGILSTGVTPFLMRLTISSKVLTDADLDLSLDFMRGTIGNGRDTWNEILGQLRSVPGFEKLKEAESTSMDATYSPAEEVNVYGY
ncbi:MAG: hypothetical protein C4586_00760 [Anaerolineaceae bacterium]|nr:MAG: hypothetical protein C4586_00760 [Anaerolineaceae bacterium]